MKPEHRLWQHVVCGEVSLFCLLRYYLRCLLLPRADAHGSGAPHSFGSKTVEAPSVTTGAGGRPPRRLMPLSVGSSAGMMSPVGLPPGPSPTPSGFFFGAGASHARKGLPADPNMEETFTTVFLDIENEIQSFKFLETVGAGSPRATPWCSALAASVAALKALCTWCRGACAGWLYMHSRHGGWRRASGCQHRRLGRHSVSQGSAAHAVLPAQGL